MTETFQLEETFWLVGDARISMSDHGALGGKTFSEKLDFFLNKDFLLSVRFEELLEKISKWSETFKARREKVINPALDEDALKTYWLNKKTESPKLC